MKIGVSSYSFSQYIQAKKLDVFGAIDEAKKIGFDGMEFISSHITGDTFEERVSFAKKIREKVLANGLELTAYLHSGGSILREGEELKASVAEFKQEIDIAAVLGAKLFRYDVIYGPAPMGKSFDMILNQIVGTMQEFADYAKQYGIMTMIENHGHTFQDAYRVEKTVNAVARDNFRLLIDIGNFTCADEVPATSVSRLATLAAHVHLKDFYMYNYYDNVEGIDGLFRTRGRNYLKGAAVGEGNVGAAQCIEILKCAGYDGYLDIEFEGTEDCVAALTRGLAFARNCIK